MVFSNVPLVNKYRMVPMILLRTDMRWFTILFGHLLVTYISRTKPIVGNVNGI